MSNETDLLISDAKQTAVFLDNNAKLQPDVLIFGQAANVIRALTDAAKPCGHMSAKDAFVEAWIQATRIGSDRFNDAVGEYVPWSEKAERNLDYEKFLEWRDQQ